MQRAGWKHDQADTRTGTGRQERSQRHGNLLTVFDPCGRVQPDTDLFEPWRLDGSRLTLTPQEGGSRKRDGVQGGSRGLGEEECQSEDN